MSIQPLWIASDLAVLTIAITENENRKRDAFEVSCDWEFRTGERRIPCDIYFIIGEIP